MRVVLSTDLPVFRVAVFAEMAWMERRPELGLLCRAARDTGNRISPAAVQAALPGLSDAGASNVLNWCRMLDLCDRNGGLTALGEDVAESNEAPVPEQGVYGMWLTKHPVIGNRVLSVERLASQRDPRFNDIQLLNDEPDRGKVFQSVLDPKERFVVRDLPSNHGKTGCVLGTTKAQCRFRWTLDFDAEQDQWQLDGKVEAPQGNGKYAMKAIRHEAETDGLDLWRLAETWASGPLARIGRWDPAARRLTVAFDGLTEAEVESFQKSIPVQRVEIPGKGVYEKATIEDVPIGPRSREEGQRWALDRLSRLLRGNPKYRTRADLFSAFVDVVDDTPLEQTRPLLPSHRAFESSDQLRASPEQYWALVAPVDLAPQPVADEELRPRKVGVEASEVNREAPGVVRVPYRGGWTMRRLADRLLAGTTPTKVLLCDRYVRGQDNLETLQVLVEAVRATAPHCSIDIWTGDEEGDFAAIRSATGSPPRSYRDVFGRSYPHDRYFLVCTSRGEGFGWHMSNSPLHARADVRQPGPETPLRWKDLAAHHVEVDELQPAFRQWMKGGGR